MNELDLCSWMLGHQSSLFTLHLLVWKGGGADATGMWVSRETVRGGEKREREVWQNASDEETAVYTQRAELSRCCCFIHTLLKPLVFTSSRNGCNIAPLLPSLLLPLEVSYLSLSLSVSHSRWCVYNGECGQAFGWLNKPAVMDAMLLNAKATEVVLDQGCCREKLCSGSDPHLGVVAQWHCVAQRDFIFCSEQKWQWWKSEVLHPNWLHDWMHVLLFVGFNSVCAYKIKYAGKCLFTATFVF